MRKPPIRSLIFFGIESYGAILLVFCSALCLNTQCFAAIIMAECAFILYRGIQTFIYRDKVEEGNFHIKMFLIQIGPGVLTIIAVGLLNKYLKGEELKTALDYFTKTVAAIIILILLSSKNLDWHIQSFVYDRKNSTKLNSLFKFTKLFRLFLILGLFLTIFLKPHVNFYFEIFSIIGCALLLCRNIIMYYGWCNCEVIQTGGDDPYDDGYYDEDSGGTSSERPLNEREVFEKVKKIADRWSLKEDTFSMLPSGSIHYEVSVEIIGTDSINYTLNGRFSGISDDKLSQAHTYSKSKINKVAA